MSGEASVAHQILIELTKSKQSSKMKLIVIAILALVAAVTAAPPADKASPVTVVRSDFNQEPEGAYDLNVETDDGTKREEHGEVKTVPDEDNKPQSVIVMRGSYSYVDPAGNPHTINYYADETGFHAEGDDVPKPQK